MVVMLIVFLVAGWSLVLTSVMLFVGREKFDIRTGVGGRGWSRSAVEASDQAFVPIVDAPGPRM
jgi:hypothetical protein